MLPELGQIALLLALVASLLQTLLPLLGAQRGLSSWMASARPAAYAQWLLMFAAWGLLTAAFVREPLSTIAEPALRAHAEAVLERALVGLPGA